MILRSYRPLYRISTRNTDSEIARYAVTYYSAIYLLKDAIERAGSVDSAAIRDALAETDGLEVPIGTYRANDMREMIHGGTICKMVDGKAEFLEYVLVED